MRTLRWLAILPLVAAFLAPMTPAGAASAKPPKTPTSVIFSAPTLVLTSSTHKVLQLFLEAERSSLMTPRNSLFVGLQLPKGGESHEWLFGLTPGSLRINVATGKGSVTTGASQIAPYGRVSLTFTPFGKTSTHGCTHTKTVTHRVHVEGTVEFDTHSSGRQSWGNLGSRHKKLKFVGHGSVHVQYGELSCAAPGPGNQPCRTGVTWDVSEGGLQIGGDWTKSHGKVRAVIGGTRDVKLAAPSQAVRIDFIRATAQPPPALTVSKGEPTLVVTNFGHGASGTAELTSPTPQNKTSQPCGGSHDEVGTEWTDASYTNGDKPLVLHEQIEGQMTIPDLPNGQLIGVSRQTD